MLKKSNILYLSRFAIIAAVLYCIPVAFFLKNEQYSQTWLLYVGNALFLISLFVFGTIYAVKKSESTKSYNGIIVTILGVVFSCVLVFLLIFIFAPGIFNIGSSKDILQQTPAAVGTSNSQGILFFLFADAIIGNFSAGSFSALLTRSKAEEEKLPG